MSGTVRGSSGATPAAPTAPAPAAPTTAAVASAAPSGAANGLTSATPPGVATPPGPLAARRAWPPAAGGTPSGGTGPTSGFGGSGSYYFCEASGQSTGALYTLTSDMFGKHEVGTAVGLAGMSGYMGGMLFSLAVGTLATTIGYNPLFVALAVFDIVAAILVWTMLNDKQAHPVPMRPGGTAPSTAA